MAQKLHHVGHASFETDDGDDRIRSHGDHEVVLVPRSLLRQIPIGAITDAMQQAWEANDHDGVAWWVTSDEDPHNLYDPTVDYRFFIHRSPHGAVEIVVPLESWVDPDDDLYAELDEAFMTFAERIPSKFTLAEMDPYFGTEATTIRLEVPASVGDGRDLLHLAREATALVAAIRDQGLSLGSSANLVKAGILRPLVGQRENSWLDAKSQPYRLATTPEKLEFAKDVAAFANAGGGLIVVGATTDRGLHGDSLTSVRPFPLHLMDPVQCRDLIRDRVFPPIEGLDIGVVNMGNERGVGFVHVPPQPTNRQPFLVRGSTVDDRVHTTFISIPTRDGEDTRWADLAELHALLQAGRLAFMQLQATEAANAKPS